MATPQGPGPDAPVLVGRDRELAALRDALAAALSGRGTLVLIGGEAGIGKTALAEVLLAEAAVRGALVLVGRCYDLSETPPYGPWAEALGRAPTGDDFPALPRAVLPPGRDGAALASQEAILHRVRDYLAALAARHPLILLLDDLHWADPATLDLLRILGRDLDHQPVLVLATYRADEVADDHALAALLPLLVREARAARLDLRPLDQAAIGALVAARYALAAAGRDRLVAYLAGRTEGNALFLGELLRSLEGEGLLYRDGDRWALGDLDAAPVPALLRQVIARRVARLDPEAARLLAVAAVVGQEIPLALWAAVGEVDEGTLLGHAERALGARLLVELPAGDRVRFPHALVRDALYAGLSTLRRRSLHRRAGEVMLAAPNPDPDVVAAHFRRAGDPRTVAWLVRAAERAEHAYAWLTAAERLEAALALLATADAGADERGRLLLHLANLRRYADLQASVAHADEALRLALAAGDRSLAATALADRGLFRLFGLDVRRGLDDLAAGVAQEEAVARDGSTGGRNLVSARGALILNLAHAGRLAEAVTLGEAYLAGDIPATAELGATNAGDAWLGLGQARALLGQPAEAARAFAQARAVYRAAGHHALLAMTGLRELALVALTYAPDRVAERRQFAVEAEEAAARARNAGIEAPPRAAALPLLLLEGHWTEALPLGLAAHAGGRHLFHMLAARLTLGPLARALGEAELAWEVARVLLPDGSAARPGEAVYHDAVAAQRLAASLALDAGDLPLARAWLDAHDRWLAWSGATLGQAEGQLGWAAYHRAAGDHAAARATAGRALAHAAAPRQPLALLAAHRTLGELETEGAQHREAAGHVAAALALADACAAPYERALTLLALADLHRATGAYPLARSTVADARTILVELAARPALARADQLAERLAVAPVPRVRAVPCRSVSRRARPRSCACWPKG